MKRTPHSGFHWNGRKNPYFEGWYYRLTLPPGDRQRGESFAFMYSVQNPSSSSQSCAVQIIGPADDYLWSTLPGSSTPPAFLACPTAARHCLLTRPWLAGEGEESAAAAAESYSVTPGEHCGRILDPDRGAWVRWHFQVHTVCGWGPAGQRQQSTAGWMSRFQLFEPGWQVLVAHGQATGWIEWSEPIGSSRSASRHAFQGAPFYGEKNWGASFPRRWFWVQCNSFTDHPGLSLTSAGGIRGLLGWEETLGMIGIHHQGVFFEFVPWNSRVSWRIAPWGSWQVWARSGSHAVELTGSTSSTGIRVRVPTADGLRLHCRDTTHGDLSLMLWRLEGTGRHEILRARSSQAGLETGGSDWGGTWIHPGGR